MGICLDIGHDRRNGKDPVEDLKKYHSRIFDVHLKDVTAASKQGYSVELGRGITSLKLTIECEQIKMYENHFYKAYGKSLTGSSKRHKKQEGGKNMKNNQEYMGEVHSIRSKYINQGTFYARRT